MPLTSFRNPVRAAVFGANGGIGAAFVQELVVDENVQDVFAVSRNGAPHEKAISLNYDPMSEDSLNTIAAQIGDVDIVLVALGTLHDEHAGPEKSLRNLSLDRFLDVMTINAALPIMIGKAMMPTLKKAGKRCVFGALSARVGSISDNRMGGWHSYRASKAALNQLIRNMSIELQHRNPEAIAVSLHPGTVDTGLSKPFQRNVPDGKLFTPTHSAGALLSVIDSLGADQSGRCFDYAGAEIAP